MSDVTDILSQIERGDPAAAEQLMPLVYDELRKLAAARLARELPGQTLQATALVHDAYIRLVDVNRAQHWNSRGHFFSAAAEAMRRILVEHAKRKQSLKRGGQFERVFMEDNSELPERASTVDLVVLDDALDALAEVHPRAVEVVKLRYFAGLTIREAAEVLSIADSTADADWAYAKAWLRAEISE